jgi:hypothetical protein
LTDDYEKLRKQAQQQPVSGSLGMTVLLTRGMAEWLQVMQAKPAIPSPVHEHEVATAVTVLAGGIKSEIVHVLATMVMTLGQEVAYGQ